MRCSSCGVLSAPGMRYCGMCGAALAGSHGRERRRVSVLFVDLAGFTTLTRDLDPEAARDLADRVLTDVAAVVEDFDGTVDSFRGDGLMALFGAPVAHPDDPERAVRAAHAALRAIEQVGAERSLQLSGRAGVTTGVVIAGGLGSGRVREYTVMGSVVNLASRLEEAALAGEVLVDLETYTATHHRLAFTVRDHLTLAGFPHVNRAFTLTNTVGPHQHLPTTPPLIGRERELSALIHAWEATQSNGGVMELLLVGETGSGKTRLLQAFADALMPPRAHPRRPPWVLWLRRDPPANHRWGALAEEIFGPAPQGAVDAQREHWHAQLATLLPNNHDARARILASMGLARGNIWRRLERRTIDRALVAWQQLLQAVANHHGLPLVLLVDADRFDPELDAFLALLHGGRWPALIVRSVRQTPPHHGDTTPLQQRTVSLSALTHDERVTLFKHLLGRAPDGEPLMLLTLVGSTPAAVLALAAALDHDGRDAWPGLLTTLLQAQIDRLPSDARQLLPLAAVCGAQTWEGLLREAHAQCDRLLSTLEAAGVVVPCAESDVMGERAWRFSSELLRVAVLQMIPLSERPMLHLRVAGFLEARGDPSLAPLLVVQNVHGGDSSRAWLLLQQAARELAASNPARVDALYEQWNNLPLTPAEHAEGAMAHAAWLLNRGDRQALARVLERASMHVSQCEPSTHDALQARLLALQAAEVHL